MHESRHLWLFVRRLAETKSAHFKGSLFAYSAQVFVGSGAKFELLAQKLMVRFDVVRASITNVFEPAQSNTRVPGT
jgi:hypothetical protein